MIKVTIGQKTYEYEDGTTLYEIAREHQSEYKHQIILAKCNGTLSELSKVLVENCNIAFVTTASFVGNECYRRSATFLMLKAFYAVAGRNNIEKISVHCSVSKGYYCQVFGNVEVDDKLLKNVRNEMIKLCKRDILIQKESIPTAKAIKKFERYGMKDKVHLLKYRRSSAVNIYRIEGFEDYFYGYMAYSTGILKYFDLIKYDEGFVLQLPTKEEPEVVPEFVPRNKVYNVIKKSTDWAEMIGVPTIGYLNDKITDGSMNNIMMVQEALQEKRIGDVAADIASRENVKVVMIAGPSSSGKTSFSHRLSIQLSAHGLKPHPIAVDNYFVDREHTPLDEFGEKNYECLEAIDTKQFNEDMLNLLSGKNVDLPTFNFKTGCREYRGDQLQLGKDDILVIEGIHGLNDKLSYALPKESKFKIYISALTQLNIDEHNRIPTTDGRLIRRIVRDARTRGTSAKDTIARWPSVRRGEEQNIFPFQEEADVMFNSALVYELACLKVYAEPLLFGIDKSEPEYQEAKRLLKFLDYFVPVPSEGVPFNSLLREFIGGSCFNV